MDWLAGRRYWIAFCVAALLIGALVISSTASGLLEQKSPRAALALRPGDPDALQQLAEGALAEGDFEQAAAFASEALKGDPHRAQAYRALAEAAAFDQGKDRSEALFVFAGGLSARDPTIASALYQLALRDGRYAEAIDYAEILVRRTPRFAGTFLTRLVLLAREPAAVPALVSRLAEGPDWRERYFRKLSENPANHAAGEALALALAHTEQPLAPDELSPLLQRMTRTGQIESAHRLWLQTLAPAQRPAPSQIYDPDFRWPAAAAPFGWTFDRGEGTEGRLAHPGETPGLYVQSAGLADRVVARQRVFVEPGRRYRLKSEARVLEGGRSSLQWTLTCDERRADMQLRLDLRTTAPTLGMAEGYLPCPTPVLSLRALPRDRRDTVLAVVDHVSLEPVE